uniref:Protein root UVB sensitive/RUS domain-containing protein n=1 Tax=Oncorhynchus tshawytscha TaxID=74940 RepID=A0A8C8CSY5_ONCTS
HSGAAGLSRPFGTRGEEATGAVEEGHDPPSLSSRYPYCTFQSSLTLSLALVSVFLPQRYPESVSGDYLQNQFWVFIVCYGIIGYVNACAVFLRLVADVLNDIAMFMEILAPNFPTCFTLTSIVGVAGGATRAALTLHQARRDNMVDISAKDGSQETLVNLAGLLVSLILIPPVRSVVMETLNEARLAIVLHQYLRDGQVLGPVEANHKEPVFLGMFKPMSLSMLCYNSVIPFSSVILSLKIIGSWCMRVKLMDQIFQPFLKGKLSVTRCAQSVAVYSHRVCWDVVSGVRSAKPRVCPSPKALFGS